VRARELFALVGLFAGVLLAALDIAIVGPALPSIRETFGVDSRSLSWVFSLYILLYLCGAPLLANLSDRRGRRSVFRASVALFGAGSLLVALAPHFDLLLAGRAVQAFGAGGIIPIAGALIAETVPEGRRGRALGLMGAVFGVAFLLGPLLGGWLLRYGWRSLFLVNLPLTALVIALGRTLPQSIASRPAAFDALGTAVLCVLLTALVLGVNQIESGAVWSSLISLRVWPFIVVVAVAIPLFWSIERRAADPVLHPDLLRSMELRVVVAIALAAGLVEAGMVFLPDFAVLGFGVDAPVASLMMLPLVITLIAGAPLAGYLVDRIGARRILSAGLVSMIAGLASFAVFPVSFATFYASGAMIGLGLSAVVGAPPRHVALAEAGEGRRSQGQGLLTLFLSIGQLGGAALIGGLVGSSSNELGAYRSALLIVAVLCTGALVVSTVLRGRPFQRSSGGIDP
jgi:MFS family permease